MIALITRSLLVLEFLVAGGIAFALLETHRVKLISIALLLGISIIVLLRLLITANNFFLSSRFRSPTPLAYRLNWLQACKLFFGEFKATMATSSWTMPFCAFSKRIVPHANTLPVLLIHGYACNSGYWHSMSKALLDAGITHRAIDMEPLTGDIDGYAPSIQEAVEILCKETGSSKIIILAHSMGGLAARAYLRRYGVRHIEKVITLGTPHRGTGVAQFGAGLNCQQMHWTADEQEGVSSEWLRELDASETKETRALFVSIYSHHDNIIAPQTSSHLPDASNIELYGIGHVALGYNRDVQALAIDQVRKATHLASSQV
jgi:triacylglycerol lipase